ncbi:MAG: TIGR02646 family protein [Chloroflexi bacterium]|nr:TIGR02646 family protein [Chloroflexota bacterium]
MRGVERSPEPDFLARLRAARSQWDDLDSPERQRIREALRSDFEGCCAYCEDWCVEGARETGSDNPGTVDHFRPRSRFPNEWLAWLNLVYACRRCNDTKGNLWPEASDATNRRLSVISRYSGAVTYVNPSLIPDQRPAGEFFEYRFDSGQMTAADGLSGSEWSMAVRTIADLDLNSDYEAVGDRLPYLRRERLDFIIRRLGNPMEDIGRTVVVLRELTQPSQPFSGFILAYARDRFPLLGEFLG